VSNDEEATQITHIADVLVAEGIVSAEQLRYAKRAHTKLASRRPLVDVMVELGYVTHEQVQSVVGDARLDLRIGDLLIELGLVSQDEMSLAVAIQSEDPSAKRRLGEILVEQSFVEEKQLVRLLAAQLGYDYIEPRLSELDPELICVAPLRWFAEHHFIPVRQEGDDVTIAFADPMNPRAIQAAEAIVGTRAVIAAIAPPSLIHEAIRAAERQQPGGPRVAVDQTDVAEISHQILTAAVASGATAIHLDPAKDRLRVRFREDGALVSFREFPFEVVTPLVEHIAEMCESPPAGAEPLHHTDRLRHAIGHKEFVFRASFFSAMHGKRLVLSLLNPERSVESFDDLGLAPATARRLREEALETTSGLLLIAGPASSGCTSTFYACLEQIKRGELNVVTVEDPVEVAVDGIAQCSQASPDAEAFEESLRHVLHQDADVVGIARIGDRFSAGTALRAALAGRRCLATYQAGDAAEALGSLVRLGGGEPFWVASAVRAVLAQRLLRGICPSCSEPQTPTPDQLRRLGCSPGDLAGAEFEHGRGCEGCRYTGHLGRIGVFEYLSVDEEIKEGIEKNASTRELRRLAFERSGAMSLLEDGLVKAAASLTTLDELLRNVPLTQPVRPLAELRRLLRD